MNAESSYLLWMRKHGHLVVKKKDKMITKFMAVMLQDNFKFTNSDQNFIQSNQTGFLQKDCSAEKK
jgi:hypothetical protein